MKQGSVTESKSAKNLVRSKFSLRRACVLAVVFSAHLCVLGYLTFPVGSITQQTQDRQMPAPDALLMRFVSLTPKSRPKSVFTVVASAKPSASHTTKHPDNIERPAHEKRKVQATPTPPVSALAASQPAAAAPALHPALPQALAEPDYIPGGTALATDRKTAFGQQNWRIPGDSFVQHSPSFRMTDSRTQGIAGAVRIIGHLLGAAEPHCVDVDSWYAMTPAERIAHHVPSDETLQEIAVTYHCAAPRNSSP